MKSLIDMKLHQIILSTLILGFTWIETPLVVAGQVNKVTLTAEISVVNNSDKDIEGYVQRISVPVSNSLQQRLVGVRFEYPQNFKRKRHRRGDSEYIEFFWNIPANSSSSREVHFDLELSDYDYARSVRKDDPPTGNRYIRPARFIESDSAPIRKLADQFRRSFGSDEERLKAAFLLPQQIIDYQVQSTKGALSALEKRRGDCTEYAALFVALARAMGYPARMTSEFLFTSHTEFNQPNHHAAEVYLNGSWIPVDANLALDPDFGYGFGVGRSKKITLTRDFAWVWSNRWPKNFRDHSDDAEVHVRWLIH